MVYLPQMSALTLRQLCDDISDVRDRIFKLKPIHATVIYQIRWIQWIAVSFKENSIGATLEWDGLHWFQLEQHR